MANELSDKDECLFKLIGNIENELAAASLFSADKDVQQSVKTCVYHIILKAIALSKDPRADKAAVLALYEVAKEIVINSQLDSDEATQNRLQDLINAIIDGDDLSAQLRLYNISNRQWLDSKTILLEDKISAITKDTHALQAGLGRIELKLGVNRIKKAPSLILMIVAGFFTMLFTIILSVVIISMVLTTANKDSFSMEERLILQKNQQLLRDRSPNPNQEMK